MIYTVNKEKNELDLRHAMKIYQCYEPELLNFVPQHVLYVQTSDNKLGKIHDLINHDDYQILAFISHKLKL